MWLIDWLVESGNLRKNTFETRTKQKLMHAIGVDTHAQCAMQRLPWLIDLCALFWLRYNIFTGKDVGSSWPISINTSYQLRITYSIFVLNIIFVQCTLNFTSHYFLFFHSFLSIGHDTYSRHQGSASLRRFLHQTDTQIWRGKL